MYTHTPVVIICIIITCILFNTVQTAEGFLPLKLRVVCFRVGGDRLCWGYMTNL